MPGQRSSTYGDAVTHIQYQHHFSEQFWKGDLYPRWLAGSNKGYGSPIFLVQYPVPYWITAVLRPITRFRSDSTRDARTLGVFCFLALARRGGGRTFLAEQTLSTALSNDWGHDIHLASICAGVSALPKRGDRTNGCGRLDAFGTVGLRISTAETWIDERAGDSGGTLSDEQPDHSCLVCAINDWLCNL